MSPTDDPASPKIFETHREPGTFMALSHCWGTQARFVLDSDSLIQLLGGMDMNGYRYLWINSLCILQDAYDDWDNDSSRMQEYYMNAILTIALDGTKGDHNGFLDRHRLSGENVFVAPFCSISGVDGSKMLSPTSSDNEFVYLSHKRSPRAGQSSGGYLAKRGWTLQEDILAASAIHYENQGLRWDCQKHR